MFQWQVELNASHIASPTTECNCVQIDAYMYSCQAYNPCKLLQLSRGYIIPVAKLLRQWSDPISRAALNDHAGCKTLQYEASKYVTDDRLVTLVSMYSLLARVSIALCTFLPQLPTVKSSV